MLLRSFCTLCFAVADLKRSGQVRAPWLDLLDDRELGQAGAVAHFEVDFFLQESISLSSKVTRRVSFKGIIRCDRYVREFAEELHFVQY